MAAGWTFLSNHGHVLVCLSLDPDARLREGLWPAPADQPPVTDVVARSA